MSVCPGRTGSPSTAPENGLLKQSKEQRALRLEERAFKTTLNFLGEQRQVALFPCLFIKGLRRKVRKRPQQLSDMVYSITKFAQDNSCYLGHHHVFLKKRSEFTGGHRLLVNRDYLGHGGIDGLDRVDRSVFNGEAACLFPNTRRASRISFSTSNAEQRLLERV